MANRMPPESTEAHQPATLDDSASKDTPEINLAYLQDELRQFRQRCATYAGVVGIDADVMRGLIVDNLWIIKKSKEEANEHLQLRIQPKISR